MKILNKVYAVLVSAVLLIGISGCSSQKVSNEVKDSKKEVIATLFPQYDFIREIAKDKVNITLLLPPGVEAHSFEPTPQDIAKISNSELFVYTGKYMEPWAQKIIDSLSGKKTQFVDASKGIDLVDEESHHEEHEDADHKDADHEDADHEKEENGHSHGGKDPHIWLDPVNAQKMVDNILEYLVKVDSSNEGFYRENANNYKNKLAQMDRNFSEDLKKVKSNKIIYGGHFAFGYFAKRYNLTHISPYEGFAPNAEPTPKKIADLIKNLKESGSTAIYYEENIEPKVAKVISEQTGAKMLLLHGAHNVSKEELTKGLTYIKIMQDNLANLKEGLGYGR
jgi:zinc transport system substrate-binding protein